MVGWEKLVIVKTKTLSPVSIEVFFRGDNNINRALEGGEEETKGVSSHQIMLKQSFGLVEFNEGRTIVILVPNQQ